MGEDVATVFTPVSVLECLDRLHWQGHRIGPQAELRGLCPFHPETHPSFYVNARKNVFYCHGCGRGGGPRRFLQLATQLLSAPAPNTPADPAPTALLEHALRFYQHQLLRHQPALQYLARRGVHDPALIQQLGLGYAPGGSLRRHLTTLGYRLPQLIRSGLVDDAGRDALLRRIVFPCHDAEGRLANLYGRSLDAPPPHRLLPGSKGGLFHWHRLRHASTVLLVEGLFDVAVLWRHGLLHTTCALGTHLNPTQVRQLCDQPARRVRILFDHDANGAGQQAARECAQRLGRAGLRPSIVCLPAGHDPNSYFTAGASAADFARLPELAP